MNFTSMPCLRGWLAAAVMVAAAHPVRPCLAQTLHWEELAIPAVSRAPRAVDTLHGRWLVCDAGGGLWSFDFVSGQWTEIELSGDRPSLSGDCMVYDQVRDRLVAFEAKFTTTVPFRMFTLALAGPSPQWTETAFSGDWPYGLATSVAYDPGRDRMLVFGGIYQFTNSNAVHAVDLSNMQWSVLATTGTPPQPRAATSAVFDPIHDRLLIYGGVTHFGPIYDETWSLSLSGTPTWSFLVPSDPVAPARYDHAAVIDPVRGVMLVAGGHAGTDPWVLDLNATPGTASWSPAPSPAQGDRQYPLLAYDAGGRRAWLFGGADAQGAPRSDQWVLPSDPPQTWSPVDPGEEVPRVSNHLLFADDSNDRLVAFGGSTGSDRIWWRALGAPGSWHRGGTSGPTARFHSSGVMDPPNSRLFVFGGLAVNDGHPLDETWEMDLNSFGWTPLTTGPRPSPRAEALWITDPARHRAILYGGRTPSGAKSIPLDDTWLFDFATRQWQPLPIPGFGGRWGVAGIVDPIRDRLVVFGGVDTLVRYGDLHELSLASPGAWTSLTTTGQQPFVQYPQSVRAAYDSENDRLLVLNQHYNSDDTLIVWSTPLGTAPSWSRADVRGRQTRLSENYALAADPAHQRIVLLGPVGNGDELWSLNFFNGTTAAAGVLSAEADAERVRISWQGDRGMSVARASRRRDLGAWTEIATLQADGNGRFDLEDRDVVPGARYRYRLGVSTAAGESFFGEVELVVPVAHRLGLQGVLGNPGRGPFTLSFTLGSDGPARLRIVDVSGRRVMSRELSLEAGAHTVRLDETQDLPAGLYFLRLEQDGRGVGRKLAILR